MQHAVLLVRYGVHPSTEPVGRLEHDDLADRFVGELAELREVVGRGQAGHTAADDDQRQHFAGRLDATLMGVLAHGFKGFQIEITKFKLKNYEITKFKS